MVFSLFFFVFGPGYSFPPRHKFCLVNFLFGQARLAVWLTRRNKIQQSGPIDPLMVFRGFVEARKWSMPTANDFSRFQAVWCVEQAVCSCTREGLIVHLTGVGGLGGCMVQSQGQFWFCFPYFLLVFFLFCCSCGFLVFICWFCIYKYMLIIKKERTGSANISC